MGPIDEPSGVQQVDATGITGSPGEAPETAVATADDFFNAKPELYRLEIPELGRVVYIRAISVGERDTWERKYAGSGVIKNMLRASLIQLVVVDASGKHIFKPNDLNRVASMPACIAEPMFDAACRQNRLLKQEVDSLGNAG